MIGRAVVGSTDGMVRAGDAPTERNLYTAASPSAMLV